MKQKKLITISIVFLLVLVAFPASATLQRTKVIDYMGNSTPNETLSRVILIKYSADGSIEQSTKYITSYVSMNLINSIRSKNSEPAEVLFERIQSEKPMVYDSIDVHSYGRQQMTTTFQQLIKNFDSGHVYGHSLMFNAVCHLEGKMLGLGFVLGTHSIPGVGLLPGGDIFGVIAGIGTLDTTGGIMDDQHISGICLGGFLGFAGVLLLVIVPMVPGPYIYMKGLTLFTFWI